MSEDGKSYENEYVNEVIKLTEPGLSNDSYFKPRFNVDWWISFDINMLKEILNHLLENERIMKEFRNDMTFRADILKNRVDQLVIDGDIHK